MPVYSGVVGEILLWNELPNINGTVRLEKKKSVGVHHLIHKLPNSQMLVRNALRRGINPSQTFPTATNSAQKSLTLSTPFAMPRRTATLRRICHLRVPSTSHTTISIDLTSRGMFVCGFHDTVQQAGMVVAVVVISPNIHLLLVPHLVGLICTTQVYIGCLVSVGELWCRFQRHRVQAAELLWVHRCNGVGVAVGDVFGSTSRAIGCRRVFRLVEVVEEMLFDTLLVRIVLVEEGLVDQVFADPLERVLCIHVADVFQRFLDIGRESLVDEFTEAALVAVLRERSRCRCWCGHFENQVEDVDEQGAFNSLQVELPLSRSFLSGRAHKSPRREGDPSYPKTD